MWPWVVKEKNKKRAYLSFHYGSLEPVTDMQYVCAMSTHELGAMSVCVCVCMRMCVCWPEGVMRVHIHTSTHDKRQQRDGTRCTTCFYECNVLFSVKQTVENTHMLRKHINRDWIVLPWGWMK